MTPTAHVMPVCGTPCWVNLMTRNLRVTQDFYSAVLGWEFRPGSLGTGFSVAFAHGRPVAGMGEVAGGRPVAGSWTPYFAVADADATAARVRERGGTVAVGPVRFPLGRGAVAADRDGAVFGFWEGRALRWSDEHGNPPAFLELRTRDAFDAAIFYAQIFDWASGEPGGCEVAYAYESDTVTVRQVKNTVATVRGGGVGESPDPACGHAGTCTSGSTTWNRSSPPHAGQEEPPLPWLRPRAAGPSPSSATPVEVSSPSPPDRCRPGR